MTPSGLLKKGLAEIRRGNYRRPLDWLVSENLLADHLRVVRPDQSPPEWIDGDGHLLVVRNPGEDRYLDETDYTCFGSDGPTTSIRVQPPSPTRRLDFDVVDTERIERVEIEAHLERSDGSATTHHQSFTSGHFFEEPVLPVKIETPEPFTSAEMEVSTRAPSRTSRIDRFLGRRLLDEEVKFSRHPNVSLPAPRTDGHPIFLISVDTFRYDFLDAFQPLIDFLGDDATVPAEPRTQGTWTRPSHAVMLTGAHPGRNGLFGYLPDRGSIHPTVETLPELLADQGYKCSGLTTSAHLLASDGFARGFHRYSVRPMQWKRRRNDAGDVVDQAIRWLERDDISEYGRGFYFLHLLDGHYPYIPPYPAQTDELDLGALDRFDEAEKTYDEYLEILYNEPRELTPTDRETILSLYHDSLSYVATQLRRLFDHLASHRVYDESFIVITGDHGEEFFERKFGRHESVNDANVRVGAIVKPPAKSDVDVPDVTDTLDIVPTVARFIGADVPETCDGRPWQDVSGNERARFVERFGFEWYVLGVERDGVKGIYTYEKKGRRRPSEDQLADGPVEIEYYRLDDVRNGHYDDCRDALPEETKTSLRASAEEFIRSAVSTDANHDSGGAEPSQAVKARLRELGYK